MIVPDSYCWTNPYVNGWIHRYYEVHFRNLYGTKLYTETQ